MTDLRLVAVTPDRSHLVLEDSQSNQFRVPIDERLAAALRTHPSTRGHQTSGQLEIALESQLTPREIQARIRAGRGVTEVAAAAGISTERVERYAAPVLAEREHVTEQARLAPARRASGGNAPRLGELIDARLADQHASPDSARWDSWRGDDDRWIVQVNYLAGAHERVARWSFDPRGRVLSAADDEARWLVDETAPARTEDGTPVPVRRLASVPAAEGEPGTLPTTAGSPTSPTSPNNPAADEVYDLEAHDAQHAAQHHPHDDPVRQVARAGRRPVLPSWDDIVFGARKRD